MILARSNPTIADQQLAGSDLPEGWASPSLRSLVTWRKGKKPDTLREASWPGAVPYIDIQAFEKWNIRRYADPSSSVLVDADDIVVVWDGARCGHVGKSPTSGALGSTLGTVKPDFVESDYILRFLQSCYDTINSNPRGTGIPHVEPELFWNLMLPLAPLAEQKRIVAKVEQLLARVNAARERLAKLPEILKRFRQSVLAAACSGRLTADWRENQTNITPVEFSIQEVLRLRKKQWVLEKGSAKKYKLPQTVRTDTLPIVPEDWEYVSSDALFSFVTSGSRGWAKYYSESGSTFIRIGNLDHDTITLDLSQIKRVNPPRGAERQRTRVQPEDILISITADVGMIALVANGLDEAYVNQHVAIARPVDGVYRPWLAWYLASTEGGQAQFQNLQRGATKVGLGLDDIRSVAVPFPPVEEQGEIVRRIGVLFKLANAIEKRVTAATARAEKLTQSILAKAFRGELVPTEAELALREGRSYEPASALLAKIEAQRKDVKPKRKHGRSRRRTRNK